MMPALGPTGEVRTSGKAVTSLVFGLFSLVTMCVTGVPAIILGALALGDINRSAGRLKGRSMATAGVVFGVIGSMLLLCVPVLIVLLLPAVQMAREAARRTHCRNNLAQIGLALHEYHDVWSSFPPPYIVDAAGRPLLSWRVLILPYLGHQTLYDDFHLNEPWDSPHNMTLASLIPTVFVCPSDDAGMPFTTAYVAISGPGTAFPYDHSVKMVDVTDGLAGTGMIGELKGSTIIWSKPDDLKLNAQFTGPGDFSSRHPGGWNMLFVDGSVRFLSDSISPADCRARMTIAGGETDEY
jgi:prepilin-type processing-associated H-X9-DG protein